MINNAKETLLCTALSEDHKTTYIGYYMYDMKFNAHMIYDINSDEFERIDISSLRLFEYPIETDSFISTSYFSHIDTLLSMHLGMDIKFSGYMLTIRCIIHILREMYENIYTHNIQNIMTELAEKYGYRYSQVERCVRYCISCVKYSDCDIELMKSIFGMKFQPNMKISTKQFLVSIANYIYYSTILP